MAFDVAFEKEVLSQCLASKEFLSQAVGIIEDGSFSRASYAWIWKHLSEAYTKHREVPSDAVWLHWISAEFSGIDERDSITETLASLIEYEPKSPKAALEEIRKFVEMNAARRGGDEVLDALDEGDIDKAKSALASAHEAVRRLQTVEAPKKFGETLEERFEGYFNPTQAAPEFRFSTFSPTLNKYMNGGLPIRRFAELRAFTGVGKTTTLVDLGYTAIKDCGGVVLYVTSEEEESEVRRRFEARITGIDRNALGQRKLTDAEIETAKRRLQSHRFMYDRLYIQYVPKGHKVSQVQTFVEMVRKDWPDEPILLCYDSPFHATGGRTYRAGDDRFERRDVAVFLENMVRDESLGLGDIAIWFTWQQKAAFEGRIPKRSAGADSVDITRSVDFTLDLRPADNLSDATTDIVEFWVTKNRLSRVPKAVIYMEVDTNTCKHTEEAHHVVEDDDD